MFSPRGNSNGIIMMMIIIAMMKIIIKLVGSHQDEITALSWRYIWIEKDA